MKLHEGTMWRCTCERVWPSWRAAFACRKARHVLEWRRIPWLALDRNREETALPIEENECELSLVELARQVRCGYGCDAPVAWLYRSRLRTRIQVSVYTVRCVECPMCGGRFPCLRCTNHGSVFVASKHDEECALLPPPRRLDLMPGPRTPPARPRRLRRLIELD